VYLYRIKIKQLSVYIMKKGGGLRVTFPNFYEESTTFMYNIFCTNKAYFQVTE
jgi:hypothetical protein